MKKHQDQGGLKPEYASILDGFYRGLAPSGLSPDYRAETEVYRRRSRLASAGRLYESLMSASGVAAGPRVGYFCNLVPEELIRACGAVPVRLCELDHACARLGEEVLPGDACPMIKSICGSAAAGRYRDLDLLVIPAACDGKAKLSELLAPVRPVYLLDLPRSSEYLRNADAWTGRYQDFFDFLKERFRSRAGRSELTAECRRANLRTQLFRRLYHFRAGHPGLINHFDYFTLVSLSFRLEPEAWLDLAGEILAEAVGRAEGLKFDGRRILLAGSPIIFPAYKVLDILYEFNCEAVADSLCSGYGHLYDPVEIDEETETGIIRALALKYLAASLCPCFMGLNKLLDLLVDTTAEYRLDGVIYHDLRLCQVFDMQTVAIRQVLKEKRIPFLSIKTDLGREDTGQLKTRIEAFLEMLG
ncbi:MAG TPA: 2-hydroxyacyl-CoA dehydratase family protein [bacterium]|uniref:Benzoyl-CoA reductase subunit C n=1 Tax=candidate division TA06 bacterium ADurb.Bin417 TaxID=1852828 RepID=A0A1V5MHN5_UNCT6|nr:MAG: Benzoyl-CoA reductase subunit C [candidate division TA06 bacterium ADurb.Bin417]HNQ34877.1 2-hydroxyacyl-CoA dehydratase family protein [bacterium]HNS48919.1 2-hydroxyacyl-CoA dehydratase family protein [bacterium]